MKKFLIILAAVCMVGAFTATAMALNWSWYGSSRMETFWYDQDAGKATFNGGKHTKQFLDWNLNAISRFGAKVKGEGPVSGRLEIGLSDVNNVYLRRIEGMWKFANGMKLTVGQTYTGYQQFISGQTIGADLGLLGVGATYGSRHPLVGLSIGKFWIAAIKPNTNQLASDKYGVSTGGEVTPWLPKFEANWGYSSDTWNINAIAGFQTYDIDRVTSLKNGKKNDLTITSWGLGLDGGMHFGPAYFKGAVSYQVNPGSAGWNIPGNVSAGSVAMWDGDDDVKDIPQWQYSVVAGFAFTDSLRFESGFGYVVNDYGDNWSKADQSDKALSAYVQAVITAAPGVYFLPEFDWFNYLDNRAGQDEGTTWALGGKWQIDF